MYFCAASRSRLACSASFALEIEREISFIFLSYPSIFRSTDLSAALSSAKTRSISKIAISDRITSPLFICSNSAKKGLSSVSRIPSTVCLVPRLSSDSSLFTSRNFAFSASCSFPYPSVLKIRRNTTLLSAVPASSRRKKSPCAIIAICEN